MKLNLGSKSASVRIGGKGFGYTTGTKGKTISAGIPGTGLSATKRLSSRPSPAANVFWSALGFAAIVIIAIVAFNALT